MQTEHSKRLIAQHIDEARRGGLIDPGPIANRVLSAGGGDSATDEVRVWAFAEVKRLVRQAIKNLDLTPDPISGDDALEPQLKLLEEFPAVDPYYSVKRDGRLVSVRVDLIEPDERELILAMLRDDIAGTQRHMEELERYWSRLDNLGSAEG